MSTSNRSAWAVLTVVCAIFALAAGHAANVDDRPQLGTPIDRATQGRVNDMVMPDGNGLPPGSGTVRQGEAVYAAKCEGCHGAAGVGGVGAIPRLTGGIGTLAGATPLKTVNSYWPYATTVFDYIRRSMPIGEPRSLPDAEVYAVTAYVLSVDGVVKPNARLDARTLPLVRMPNREGFVPQWREPPLR